MKVSDWFLGCPKCGNQYPANSAGPTRCNCGGRMLHCRIEEKDREEITRHDRAAIALSENRSEYS